MWGGGFESCEYKRTAGSGKNQNRITGSSSVFKEPEVQFRFSNRFFDCLRTMVLSRTFSFDCFLEPPMKGPFDFVVRHITSGSGFLKIVKMKRSSCAWCFFLIIKMYIYIYKF